mmetsp:Transcript_7965/g.15874  ORF Transcript_7965/g.15874 Transcript_7965/m.15874 type:complete len:194 (+) Transcript_7965:132-713(+)
MRFLGHSNSSASLFIASLFLLISNPSGFASAFLVQRASALCSPRRLSTTPARFAASKGDPFGKRPPDRSAVELVMKKTLVPMRDAVRALVESDGQIMDAVMLLNEEQRERLDERSALPEGEGVNWDEELKTLSSINEEELPLGADGADEQITKRKEREKMQQRMDKWKLEGEDADWMPGFSASKNPDEPWFTG